MGRSQSTALTNIRAMCAAHSLHLQMFLWSASPQIIKMSRITSATAWKKCAAFTVRILTPTEAANWAANLRIWLFDTNENCLQTPIRRQAIGVKATALHFLDTKNENDTDEASKQVGVKCWCQAIHSISQNRSENQKITRFRKETG